MNPKQEALAAEMRQKNAANPGSGGWDRGLRRAPIRKKRAKPRRGREYDLQYLKWIRSRPCYACERFGQIQCSNTEAAHVGLRGFGQKCDDRKAIPLCVIHHRIGVLSAHQNWKAFWEAIGLEASDVISIYNAKYLEKSIAFD